MEVKDILKQQIISRVRKRLTPKLVKELYNANIRRIYLAGGSLNKCIPNDLDFYPVLGSPDIKLDRPTLSKTKNAVTYEGNPPIQFCFYYHANLKKLVDSFDFAHIQVGVVVKLCEQGWIDVERVYYTNDYVLAHMTGKTFYTGSQYPLSSLIRIQKYIKRGWFENRSYIIDIMKIITDIMQRGFNGYEDFKDQLDAVDLGLLPDELEDILKDDEYLRTFFELLDKRME